MRYALALASILAALVATPSRAQSPAPSGMFPFVIPWDDSSKGTATDVSFLNAKPAGVNGRITVEDGHFVESGTGKRIRFFGMNMGDPDVWGPHRDSDRVAAHIAKLGINLVRIQTTWLPLYDKPFWPLSPTDHTKIDVAALDNLDYFIAQLKKNGIYVDINLKAIISYSAMDGFPEGIHIPSGRIDYLDRRMIELQKQFAHDLLTHVNPYTGLNYGADPAIAIYEINNENSLAGWTTDHGAWVEGLDPYFKGEVLKAWNDYLAAKYHTTTALVAAWGGGASPASAPDVELLDGSRKWLVEDRVGDVTMNLTGPGTAETMPDVLITNPTPATPASNKQLHVVDLNLADGGYYVVALRAKTDTESKVALASMLNVPPWRSTGLNASLNTGPDWRDFKFGFKAVHTVPNQSRLSFILGDHAGTLALAGVRLTSVPGLTADDVLPEGQSIEAGTIGVPPGSLQVAQDDWRSFAVGVEVAYANEMRHYIHSDLHCVANLTNSQMLYGNPAGLAREADSDFVDDHTYWEGPVFEGGTWDPNRKWTVPNTPMADSLAKRDDTLKEQRLNKDGDVLWWVAANRVAGKPFTVSEYNHTSPSDYDGEMFPELAGVAALQDWDAIMPFNYGRWGEGKTWDKLQSFFAIQGDPAKEGFLPAAAILFRQGLIGPLGPVATLRLPPSAASGWVPTQALWSKANGGKTPGLFASRYQIRIDAGATSARIEQSQTSSTSSGDAIVGPGGAQYFVRGPGGAAAAGFLGGGEVDLGAAKISVAKFGNNFASLMLVALDGKPIATSSHLLLTIVGRTDNTGVVWNEARTSIGGNLGTGPALAEGVPATLTLGNAHVKHAWALDPTGARGKAVPVTVTGGQATMTVGPDYQTIWYEIGK